MFTKIMAPVDLAHVDGLGRALECAADLAVHYDVPLVYVGVTTHSPSALGHNFEEYSGKLKAFAEGEKSKHGIKGSAHAMVAHDPATDVDDAIMRAIDETGADLVVMGSHLPRATDYIWPSNGGKIAEHAKCSVMVVRT